MTELVRFVPTPMIRSATAELIGRVLRPRQNRRPSNVPLGVDNLWEWVRPPNLPSRRCSAFASPTVDLASRSGPADGVACTVSVRMPAFAAQLAGCCDARYHADVLALGQRIDTLCRDHPSLEPLRTQFLVDPNAVSALLRPLGEAAAAELRSAVTFWDGVIPIRAFGGISIDPVGEFFFEAPDGYVMGPWNP